MIVDHRGVELSIPWMEELTSIARRCAVVEVGGPQVEGRHVGSAWPITRGLFVALAPLDAPVGPVVLRTPWVRGTRRGPRHLADIVETLQFGSPRGAINVRPSLALLRIRPADVATALNPLPIVTSRAVRSEDRIAWVVGFTGARHRIEVSAGERTDLTATYLFHRAPTLPGSSGGPVLDRDGRVTAVHLGSSREDPSNYALRIPALLEALGREAAQLLAEVLETHDLDTPARATVNLAAPPIEADKALQRVRGTAATLWAFNPSRLGSDNMGWRLLGADVDVASTTSGKPSWSLSESARRQALEQLGGADAIRSARAMARPFLLPEEFDPKSPVPAESWAAQRVVDALLLGEVDLRELDEAGLNAAARATDWFSGHLPGLPEPDAIAAARGHLGLFGPLRQLAGDEFAGRSEELSALASWVGVSPDGSGGTTVPAGPLLLTGPGGVGKSALLAAYVRSVADRDDAFLPFATLDFDRPAMLAANPGQLTTEVVRQLGVQGAISPLDQERFEAMVSAAGADVAPALLATIVADALRASHYPTVGPPLLLLLDSYEEIQPAPGSAPPPLLEWLQALQGAWPPLRVAVAGRSDIGALGLGESPFEIELPTLDAEASAAILAQRSVPEAAREAVIRIAHGNPLALRLASDLALRLDARGESLQERELASELVDGVLYRRILDHLWDEEVEELAHPGLVLRRVTPEIIQRVLAGPAGLGTIDGPTAERLFQRLGAVGSLVRYEGRILRHRSDVRRLVVRLLEADEPNVVAAVEAAAIAYYEALSSPEPWQQAELLYHRLRTDRSPNRRDHWQSLWGDELRPFFTFEDAKELDGDAASWLRGRIGQGGAERLVSLEDPDAQYFDVRQLQQALGKGDHRQVLKKVNELGSRVAGTEQGAYVRALAMLTLEDHAGALAMIESIMWRTVDPALRFQAQLVRAEAAEFLREQERRRAALDEALEALCEAPSLRAVPELPPEEDPVAIALTTLRWRQPTVQGWKQRRTRPSGELAAALWSFEHHVGVKHDPRIRPLLRYAAVVGDPEVLIASVAAAGIAQWQRSHVAVWMENQAPGSLPELEPVIWLASSVTELADTASGAPFRQAIEDALVALPEVRPGMWARLADRLHKAGLPTFDAVAALTDAHLGPTMYARLRGWERGSEEVVEL